MQACVDLCKTLFHTQIRVLGADGIYATNANRTYCRKNNIITGFVRKGRAGKYEEDLKKARQIINIKRSTEMEGSIGKHKNHYSLNRVTARTE